MTKNTKNKMWMIISLVLNVAIMIYLLSQDSQMSSTSFEYIKAFNIWFILAAVGTISLYLFLDSYSYWYLIRMFTGEKRTDLAFRVSLLGKYYDAITPFGSGGQPFQLYTLTKGGLSAGHSSCVILIKYLIYQICFCVIGLIALIFASSKMLELNKLYFYFAILGIIINFALPMSIFLLTHKKARFEKIYFFFVRMGIKLHLVKNEEKAYSYVQRVVYPFIEAIGELRQHKSKAVWVVFISLLEILSFISLPYIVYLSSLPSLISAGTQLTSWFEITFLYLFVYFVVSIFPLPGGTGAAEFGFTWVFSTFFTQATLPLSVVIWRSVSYYFPLFVGFGITIFDSIRPLWFKKFGKSKELPQ